MNNIVESKAYRNKKMPTYKLLAMSTVEGAVWLMCAGAMLGAAYGFLLLLLTLLSGPETTLSNLLGRLAFLLLIGIMVAMIGGTIGGILGMVVGMIDGLLIGLVSRLFFFPPTNRVIYRTLISAISAVVSAAGVFTTISFVLILMGGRITLSPPPPTSFVAEIPVLAAAFGGWWAGARVAACYASEHDISTEDA